MFKKIIAVFLTVVICFSLFAVTISASVASTFDISSATKISGLSISGTTATCKSSYSDYQTVATITIVQTLQKKSGLWNWSSVGSDSTRTYTNLANVAFTTTKPSITSGTYRLKSVFTVTLSDGTSETVTVYSSEETV